LTLETKDGIAIVRGKDFSISIDKKAGEIINYKYKNTELLHEGLKPNFWRPPTDNDLGNGMHKWAKVWKDAGLPSNASVTINVFPNNQQLKFGFKYTLESIQAEATVYYTVDGDGELTIDYEFSPSNLDLPNLPRIGMLWKTPSSFQFLEWYGRGPHETYWDRKSSGEIAKWKGKVWDQIHRYSRPQETGNKTDVRWMSLKNGEGIGIKIETNSQPLSMSVWQLDTNDLDFEPGKKGAESASGLVPVTSKHGAELMPADFITWNIDLLQMGVGGDNSWGRPVHEKYTIPPKVYKYSFKIKPFETL